MLSPRTLIGRLTTRSCLRKNTTSHLPLKARTHAHPGPRLYSTGGQEGHGGSDSKDENHPTKLTLALSYGACITALALVGERCYYGSPAKRNQAQETPTYGTPEDFERAIQSLRQELSHIDGGVSTNPDDLHAHGFSVNDYHPGAYRHSAVVFTRFLLLCKDCSLYPAF